MSWAASSTCPGKGQHHDHARPQAQGPVDRFVATARRGVDEEYAVAVAKEAGDVTHAAADQRVHVAHQTRSLLQGTYAPASVQPGSVLCEHCLALTMGRLCVQHRSHWISHSIQTPATAVHFTAMTCHHHEREHLAGPHATPLAGHARGHRCPRAFRGPARSEEHTSELQSRRDLVCRLLLEKKKKLIQLSTYKRKIHNKKKNH